MFRQSARKPWTQVSGPVNHVVNFVDTERFTVYSDIPGHIAAVVGPCPQRSASQYRSQTSQTNIPPRRAHRKRHLQKSNKYAHFVTDCSSGTIKCKVTFFEISSRGLITARNSEHLHKHTTTILKRTSNYPTSRKIFLPAVFYSPSPPRSTPTFQEPHFLPAPFQEKTKEIPARSAGHKDTAFTHWGFCYV